MSDYDKVEAAVEKFLKARKGARFEGRELLEFITASIAAPKSKSKPKSSKKAGSAHPERELGELAMNVLNSFEERILSDFASGQLQTSSGFFKGALFRATPSKAELEEGILLPYPRLAFFCNPELATASDFTLSPSDAPSIKAIKTTESALALESLAESHILLGRNTLSDYLVAEAQDNFEALKSKQPSRAQMRLSVFDMREYYKASSFKEGDSLIFEVLDWTKGRYSFRRETLRATEAERNAWMKALERALAQTWRDFGDYLETADQVASALFIDACAGGDLICKPCVGLDEAHRLFKEIALVQNGGEWSLVPSEELAEEMGHEHSHDCGCGHDHEAEPVKGLAPDDFAVSKGAVAKAEDILREIKFPYPLPVFQAMIYDEMANGCESFEEFHSRHLAGLELTPVDDAQEVSYLNFVEDLWEDAVDRFSPTNDEPKAPLRTRILELARSSADILTRIVAQTLTERRDQVLSGYKLHHPRVAELQRDIVETLALLNADNAIQDESEYDALELRVGDMEELWESLLEVLEPIATGD